MYFPQDMNFQYFFFSTYPGYFLQALPFALTAGIIYIVYQKTAIIYRQNDFAVSVCLLYDWAFMSHPFSIHRQRYLLLSFLPPAKRKRTILVHF